MLQEAQFRTDLTVFAMLQEALDYVHGLSPLVSETEIQIGIDFIQLRKHDGDEIFLEHDVGDKRLGGSCWPCGGPREDVLEANEATR